MPDLVKGLVVCAALASSAQAAVAQDQGGVLQPRLLLPLATPTPAPERDPRPAPAPLSKTRGLVLQGAEPVAELKPRLLPIPVKK